MLLPIASISTPDQPSQIYEPVNASTLQRRSSIKNAFFPGGDLIMPCHSLQYSAAMSVPKKNGKLRLVIDYRQLNKQTVKCIWPILYVEDIFFTLVGSSYFSTIDLSAAFFQVLMDRDGKSYTVFRKPFGSLKWLQMPMGLTSSPNTFQILMDYVLSGLTWKTYVPYLDDCILFSETAEDHNFRLRANF